MMSNYISVALAAIVLSMQQGSTCAFTLPSPSVAGRSQYNGFSPIRPMENSRMASSRLFMAFEFGPNPRDLYEVLGVDRDAGFDSIKEAYYKAFAEYMDPGKAAKRSDEEKATGMRDLDNAMKILTNYELRGAYDKGGHKAVNEHPASDPNYDPEKAREAKQKKEAAPTEAVAAIPSQDEAYSPQQRGLGGNTDEMDIGEIFDSFFGGSRAGRGRRRSGPVDGDDLRFDLDIDFKKAVFGGEEKIQIRHLETCSTCGGNGIKPGAKVVKCRTCKGRGVIVQSTSTPLGTFQTQSTCPDCRGEGEKIEEYCNTCGGAGTVQTSKQIKVTIPPGVEDGSKLRVKGEGDAGKRGGDAGDLYIFIKVRDDAVFRREGPEIYSETSISAIDAVLGASVKTRVVDGEVTIKIPPGTQPGQVMRLKGNGAPRLGNPSVRGDHFVTVKVDIPNNLSKEERDLFERLKELRKQKEGKKGGWAKSGNVFK